MPRKREKKAGVPEWMCTFADMMSLLLCFFVLLFSLSTIIIKKKVHAIGSMTAAFGGLPAPFIVETIPDRMTPEEISRPIQPERRQYYAKEEITRQEEHKIRTKNLEPVLQVTGTEQGITFRLSGDLAFERGSSTLTPDGILALINVAEAVNLYRLNPVKVDGHTDSTRRADDTTVNWRLAADRAYTVMQYLIDWGSYNSGQVDHRRFSYESFGEFRPLPHVDPNTAIGQRLNRRVEITLVQTDQGFGVIFDEETVRDPRSPLVSPELFDENEAPHR